MARCIASIFCACIAVSSSSIPNSQPLCVLTTDLAEPAFKHTLTRPAVCMWFVLPAHMPTATPTHTA
jgi:hypothetical protein